MFPSLMIGSAVTGALSMIFGCELRVPHGGIFAVADDHDVIAAMAIDQRGSLKKAIAKAKGGDASDVDERRTTNDE